MEPLSGQLDADGWLRAVEAELHLPEEGRGKRQALLGWLRWALSDDSHDHSVSDLIVLADKEGLGKSVASMLLRLYGSGRLPEVESKNDVGRALVSLAEDGQPELCGYVRLNPKAQTFQKLQSLATAHQEICTILAPLAVPFADIESALAARKPVLGALNHSLIQRYGAIFDLRAVKILVEGMFHALKQVQSAGATLLEDIEACKKAIADARRLIQEGGSFLTLDLLPTLIDQIDLALSGFVKASRSRFATSVQARFSTELQKRYPLHEASRELQISIPFSNRGPGLALAMQATVENESEAIFVANRTIHVGNVAPGEFSLVLDVVIIEPLPSIDLSLMLEWGEIGEAARKVEVFDVSVQSQRADIDWSTLEYWRPYSTEPAQGAEFVGREEKVHLLATKLLRTPMESFYITGQKRVGKTSLALAVVEFARKLPAGSGLHSSYNLWGSFAYENPRDSMIALGGAIDELIRSAVPELRNTPKIDCTGSLAPLVKLSELALKLSPESKFVVIIDEFDEIHQELYLHGNLAETFFANLRALSRCKNMCLMLVGGENMPYVMERQGQKLNNFSRVNLTSYERDREWVDFRLMVEAPTSHVIKWHEDAVSDVFNISNGNPFFAKLVCAFVTEGSISARDTDVSVAEVRQSTEFLKSSLDSNSFAHLWQDGIPKPAGEREPEILIRSRVLVALARCLRFAMPPTLQNIYAHRSSPSLSEAQTAVVLKDFVRRDVLDETVGIYEFELPIFGEWLVDVGVNQLAADKLTEELADAAIQQELRDSVRSEEIAGLVKAWPTYRGMHVGSDDVRAWLQQVPSMKDQRILFELLKHLRIFTEVRVRELLKDSFSFLQPLPPWVIKKRSDRRRNIIVTYVDGEGKSGPTYASMFAEENLISGDCIFPPGEFEQRWAKHLHMGESIASLVIVDDLVGTGRSLAKNVASFMESYQQLLSDDMAVRVISLAATEVGKQHVLHALSRITFTNIDFKACEVLGSSAFAFGSAPGFWGSQERFDRAKALLVDLGRRVYRGSPLGFGDQGLLAVFPTNVPNNSIPVLHSRSRPGEKGWMPLFERVTH